ncbi:hypothetical protein [Paenibacillus tritici]|nr:hypothetical protein [Paenibacillus tritici]
MEGQGQHNQGAERQGKEGRETKAGKRDDCQNGKGQGQGRGRMA